jgi:hypothetical protein
MAAAQLKTLLNGPVVAGVGATVDAGLATDRYHVLPWDPTEKVELSIKETSEGIKLGNFKRAKGATYELEPMLKYAVWNVEAILGIDGVIQSAAGSPEEFKNDVKLDAIAIIFLCLVYGYYAGECRVATEKEKAEIGKVEVAEGYMTDVLNPNRLNRAATFILARMHTKYQTNHAIGGTPMQASMASSVRAFYGVSPSSARSAGAKAQVKVIADILYWATHPANETLLMPSVIRNTRISSTWVHKLGPAPELLVVEEYFEIRARTPPASTHHFYVAAAAIKQLEPMGILAYLPEPTRTKDIVAGLRMIEAYGARLHPAARYWGLDRLTANQKLVETVCADVGYAVKKLMPASSLAASPILQKEDGLDSAWKGLIDAIRAAMDDRGKELLDEKVFKQIKKSIAPKKAQIEGIAEIKGYLMAGSSRGTSSGPKVGDPADTGAEEEAEDNAEESEEEDKEEEAGGEKKKEESKKDKKKKGKKEDKGDDDGSDAEESSSDGESDSEEAAEGEEGEAAGDATGGD